MENRNVATKQHTLVAALNIGLDNSAFDQELGSTSADLHDNGNEENNRMDKGHALKSLPVRIRWYIYTSHFLSAWSDRMWNFGIGLFIVITSPDSLRMTAIYGLSMGAAILLFGALVGDWVDRTPRISAARISLVVQNSSVAVCAGMVYIIIRYQPEIQTMWPNDGLMTLSYVSLIAIAIVSTLASTASKIAVERDWLVEICGDDKDMLASTSATLKSIDLITKIVAPIATGQIMAYASPEIGALFIGGWNVVSVFVEYYLLWKVYESVPSLKATKYLSNMDKDKVQTNDVDVVSDGIDSKPTCRKWMFSGILVIIKGWKTYMKYDVSFAGLALSALYMTVLGFDNITLGFAYIQGVNESVMGIFMAAGAVVGILGTMIYTLLRKRIGLERTGLLGLFFQVTLLSLCVVSVWAPGSPIDLFYWKKENDIDSSILGFRNVSDIVFENTTTGEPERWTNSPNVSQLATEEIGTVGNLNTSTELITPSESSRTTFISIGLLIAGIIGARCGLWMADLTITQLFLESVVESERGIVFGVQTSLNQLMDMLKFIMVVVAPQPEVFGLLILISYAFVCMGWLLYAKYSHSVRGHLFHFNKLNCRDAKNNKNAEVES